MRIVILDGYAENPGDLSWDGFAKLGALTVYDRTPTADTAEIIKRIGRAELVITNKTPITEEILAACESVRYIGLLSTGYNIVELDAATRRGIPVTNVPAYSTQAVSQFAIALLLEICHHIGHHDAQVHQGRWAASQDFCFWDYPLTELAGKTMGIIGFGQIGQATARIASALSMRVLAHSRTETEAGRALAKYVPLDTLFAQSDVISLHCPLLPETQGMIDAAAIAKMKDGVILINTARGPLIVEEDVAAALKSGKMAAAGMDVVSAEPIKADNPLLSAPNCIITPHIAWASKESRARLMDIAVSNLEAFLQGTPQNAVNRV